MWRHFNHARKWFGFAGHGQVIYTVFSHFTQIAKTLGSTSNRCLSHAKVSDRCLIDADPMVFAIWVTMANVCLSCPNDHAQEPDNIPNPHKPRQLGLSKFTALRPLFKIDYSSLLLYFYFHYIHIFYINNIHGRRYNMPINFTNKSLRSHILQQYDDNDKPLDFLAQIRISYIITLD